MKPIFRDTKLLHRQVRIGRKGKPIRVVKLRTLPLDAHEEYGKNSAHHRDPFGSSYRVQPTRLGSILRKTKLDELPQLANVLRGELRLISWRPITRQEFKQFPEDVKELYKEIGPGLFGIYYSLPKKERTAEACIELFREFADEWKKSPTKANLKYFPRILWNTFR